VRPPDTQAIVTRLPDLVNADDTLVRRGARLSTAFLLAIDDVDFLIQVVAGRLHAVERGPFLLRSWACAAGVECA
jgi:hypothetical protein